MHLPSLSFSSFLFAKIYHVYIYSARARLTNTRTRFTLSLNHTHCATCHASTARIRRIAVAGGADWCCCYYCCCYCCDVVVVVVVAVGYDAAAGGVGGGLIVQSLVALLSQQTETAVAVKRLTPSPLGAVAFATWTISPRNDCRPSSTYTGCTTVPCDPCRTPCGTFCFPLGFGDLATGANFCCWPSLRG